jgi:hypothetical protein
MMRVLAGNIVSSSFTAAGYPDVTCIQRTTDAVYMHTAPNGRSIYTSVHI